MMKTILPVLPLIFLVSCSQPHARYDETTTTSAQRKATSETEKPVAETLKPFTSVELNPATNETVIVSSTSTNVIVTTQSNNAAAVTSTNVTMEPGANGISPLASQSPPAAANAALPQRSQPTPVIPPAAPATMPTPTPSPEPLVQKGEINLSATDLNQVLQLYGELVNRTILRPANLSSPPITLKTQTPLTRQEAIDALNAVLGMNGVIMINVGDKFVKAVPSAQAGAAAQAPQIADTTNMTELGPYVTHIVQLKYVKPSDIVPALQPFASMPSSILPIDPNGIMVLRDLTENVKRMLEMITRIDVAIPSEYVSEVIPIKYAKASDISDALNGLGGGGGVTTVGRQSTGPGRTGAPGGMGGIGGGLNRPGYGSAGYAPGSTSYGAQGAGGIGSVNSPAGTPSSASNFADRLGQLVRRASASGELQILGQNKIIADERSNSLLVFATKPDMEMIKNIVAKLDVVLAQVLIETVILDVQMDNGWSFGLSGVQTPHQFSSDPLTKGAGAMNNGQPLLDLINGVATNAFALGNLPGGFTYWAQISKNFNIALQAAANENRINVIQRPQILTTHATPASIFIGNTVPYITSTYYGGGYAGGPSSSYQQLQVGIGLTVTPYINADGLVVMQIDESIDEISGSTAITGVGDVPNTTSRRLSAEVAVRDGDSIVLGGFIRNSDNKSNAGVPILKDIPLLGALFSNRSDAKERKELLVLMKPTVLKTPDIAALATLKEKGQMPGVSTAEADVRFEESKELIRERNMQLRRQRFLTPEEKKAYEGMTNSVNLH